MENQKLQKLRDSLRKDKRRERALKHTLKNLRDAQENLSSVVEDVEGFAQQIGSAYRLGNLFAPNIEQGKCLARRKKGQSKADTIGHYQGYGHGTLEMVELNAARRLHRQNRPAEDYVALKVAINLLHDVVNFRADFARLEAAACEGALAYKHPQVKMSNRVFERLTLQVNSLDGVLSACETVEDVVLLLCSAASSEIQNPDERFNKRMGFYKERARKAGHGVLLFELQKCEIALSEVQERAANVDSTNPETVGDIVHDYFDVVRSRPGAFGLDDEWLQQELNRRPRPTSRKGKGTGKANKREQPEKHAKAS